MASADGSAPSTIIPARIQSSPWSVLLVLTLGFFMILLDTTIVNVAIPSMITSLHASLTDTLWVLNGYILVYAILLITAGWLGDVFGPRLMFLVGLGIFTLASVACGLSTSPGELIIFRVIQGAGGAILTPQSLSMIVTLFPADKRGAAFGVWGAVAGLAAMTGPTLGGFLTTSFSWNAIFFVNAPVGVIALVLAFLFVPELKSQRAHRFDLVGMLLSSGALLALIYAIIEGQPYGWGRILGIAAFDVGGLHAGLLSIPSLFLLSAVLFILFVIWEPRQEFPLLPLSIFRNRNFSVANLSSIAITFGMNGFLLPMVLFLQSVLGLNALHAGFVFLPMTVTSTFVAPIAGKLTDRVNGKLLLAAGGLLFGVGILLVLRSVALDDTGASFILPLIVAGIGLGLSFAPLTTIAMHDLAPDLAESASGVLNTTRQLGGALGTAVAGAVLQGQLAGWLGTEATRLSVHLPAHFRATFIAGYSRAGHAGLQVGRGQTGAPAAHGLPPGVAHELSTLGRSVFNEAFVLSLRPTLAVAAIAMFLGGAVALTMRSAHVARQRRTHHFAFGYSPLLLIAPRHRSHAHAAPPPEPVLSDVLR